MFAPVTFWQEAAAGGLPRTATGIIPGRTASYIWMFEESSGNIIDELTSLTLTQTGTAPTYSVSGSPTFPDDTGIGHTDGANSRFAAAASSSLDYTTGSFAFMLVADLNATPSADRNVLTKVSGSTGYNIKQNSLDRVSWLLGDGSFTTISSTNGYADSYVACFACDQNADLSRITIRDATNNEEITTSIAGEGSYTSTGVLRVGSSGGTNSAPINYWALYVFEGSDAEGSWVSDLSTFWTTYAQ